MNNGDEELSYSENSSVQEEAWLMNQNILERAIQSLLSKEQGLSKGLNIADLGCGVGAVPLAFVTLVIKIVQKKCKELEWDTKAHQFPNIQIYMNDLPSNDFNFLFRDLQNLEVLKPKDDNGVPLCFLMGAPGSYYHRLFPHNALHFVHSNYALHWLSQVPSGLYNEHDEPINKGNIYISETSPEIVAKAYLAQYEQDFTQFLKYRSEEVVSKGLMLLTVTGRPSSKDSFTWQTFELTILTKALTSLVYEGLIKEEKLDNFDFPVYCASKEQIQSLVKKEGSFLIKETKTIAIDVAYDIEDKWEKAQFIAKYIGAFSKSSISHHFGEDKLTPLYDKLIYHAFQHLAHGLSTQNFAITILLEKV